MIKKNVTRRNLIERLNKKKKCFFFCNWYAYWSVGWRRLRHIKCGKHYISKTQSKLHHISHHTNGMSRKKTKLVNLRWYKLYESKKPQLVILGWYIRSVLSLWVRAMHIINSKYNKKKVQIKIMQFDFIDFKKNMN